MISKNKIRLRTPSKISNQFKSECKETFNHSRKPKNIFREYSNISQKRLKLINKPNMHNSFMNSSAPFNYYRNPDNKNKILVNYNGGPQKEFQSFIQKDDYKTISNDKRIIYRNYKPCGCLPKYYMPKLSRSVSYNEFEKTNYIPNLKNNSYNNYNNENLALSNNNSLRTSRKYNTPNFRISNDGKIILTLKKFKNENNYEDNNNLRYENNGKNDFARNTFYSSFYGFRPRLFNIFHKTQIFNRCKPFLVDEFQEFPE